MGFRIARKRLAIVGVGVGDGFVWETLAEADLVGVGRKRRNLAADEPINTDKKNAGWPRLGIAISRPAARPEG